VEVQFGPVCAVQPDDDRGPPVEPVVSNNLATDFAHREWRLCPAVVVVQKTPDAVPPANGAGVTWDTVDQFIAEASMVAFAMVVGHELGERTTEMPLPERNHAVQAFLFD
jgi:hypothetical protein